MNMSIKALVWIASVAGLSIATATLQFAQSANRMMGDNSFATKAAQGGKAEVELGKLAQSHASIDKVKQFDLQMATDYSKAGDDLSKIAAQKTLRLLNGLNAKDQATGQTFQAARRGL
jgi:putative membrane protein